MADSVVIFGVSEDIEILPLEFGPRTEFFIDADGTPGSVEDGVVFWLGDKGKVRSEFPPPLNGNPRNAFEDVRWVSREEALAEAMRAA